MRLTFPPTRASYLNVLLDKPCVARHPHHRHIFRPRLPRSRLASMFVTARELADQELVDQELADQESPPPTQPEVVPTRPNTPESPEHGGQHGITYNSGESTPAKGRPWSDEIEQELHNDVRTSRSFHLYSNSFATYLLGGDECNHAGTY